MSDTPDSTSVTVPKELVEEARALVRDSDLSAYMIRALLEQVRRDRSVEPAVVAAALDEVHTQLRRAERERLGELIGWMEETNGPTSEESVDELREELHRAALDQGVNLDVPLPATEQPSTKLTRIAEYYDARDLNAEIEAAELTRSPGGRVTVISEISLPKALMDQLREAAAEEDTQPTVLMRRWIEERLVQRTRP